MDNLNKPVDKWTMNFITILGAILLFLGFCLAAMGTFLMPLLAWLGKGVSSRKKSSPSISLAALSMPLSLDILIPAHHEPQSLPASLEALKKMRDHTFQAQGKAIGFSKIQLRVALSAWQGSEANLAAAAADQIVSVTAPGKWQALKVLVAESQADWVALVDAGTVWEMDALLKLAELFRAEDVVAINPGYGEQDRGRLQKLIWAFESRLKLFENKSGGPISLHGATIFYRRVPLQKAFAALEGREWFNDDVVLPLTLRVLYPQMRVSYTLDTIATDLFPSWSASEISRRRRMVEGNIQWVQYFLVSLLKTAPLLFLIALRRVSRMMWAWWLAFPLLGMAVMFPTLCLPVLALAGLVIWRSPSARRLAEAFWISFLCPFYFLSFRSSQEGLRWK